MDTVEPYSFSVSSSIEYQEDRDKVLGSFLHSPNGSTIQLGIPI